MTDFTQLSDKELSEAIDFHRRQRNLSRGVNEAMHMRHVQNVRLLEAEEARRLNEENPNHYVISRRQNGEYGVSQRTGNDYSWDHSLHHGTHKTVDAAKTWAAKHAGKYPHKIEVKEEVEQIDELSKDTLNSYWKKAATARYPLDVKARKAQDQKTNRIRSGKPLAGYKPKDELSPEEKRTHMNRIKGMNNAGKRLFRSEEVELDEANKPNQYIEVTNKFTGAKSYHEVHPSKAFAALNHHNSLWNTKSSRIVSGKEAEGIRASKMKKEEVDLDEASYRDIGYANMLKADRKAEKELAKLRAQQAKAAAKASKPEEFKEEAGLRITKVYNKWPKKATYAVHNADRSYHKEFDSMEDAQAHKAEKSK